MKILVQPVPDITTMRLTELIMILLLVEVNIYRARRVHSVDLNQAISILQTLLKKAVFYNGLNLIIISPVLDSDISPTSLFLLLQRTV